MSKTMVIYFTMLYHSMPYDIVLSYIMPNFATLYCIILCYHFLYCLALYLAVLSYIVLVLLYYIFMYYGILCYIVLHCTVLKSIAPRYFWAKVPCLLRQGKVRPRARGAAQNWRFLASSKNVLYCTI